MTVLTQEMTRSAGAAGAPQLVFVMKVLPGLAPPDAASLGQALPANTPR